MAILHGAASNLIRLVMVFYGRRLSLSFRVILGAVFVSIGSITYLLLYFVLPRSDSPVDSAVAVRSIGFWFGLLAAFMTGAANAQLMSTGFAAASQVSRDYPVANSLFFAGQSVATILCWPIKLLIEFFTLDPTTRIVAVMIVNIILSVLMIPLCHFRISPFVQCEDKSTLRLSQAVSVLKRVAVPVALLWLIYFGTPIVMPGQVMQWGVVVSEGYLSDSKSYRSLCAYIYLVSDALSKFIPVILSASPTRLDAFLGSRLCRAAIGAATVGRLALIPLFISPPDALVWRFLLLVGFGSMCGLPASLALSWTSHRVPPEQKDVAGFLASFLIMNGYFFGSLTGILLKSVLNQ